VLRVRNGTPPGSDADQPNVAFGSNSTNAIRVLLRCTSVAPRKRQSATKKRPVVKGHFQTHALQQSRGSVEIGGSGIQLIEQLLRLFQIERIKAFAEPAVDRSEKLASP
jgi:hypothetical protein